LQDYVTVKTVEQVPASTSFVVFPVTFMMTNGRMLKANLSWSPTRAKFCQWIGIYL